MMPECFFSRLGGCEGRLVRAHWISKSRITREFPRGAWRPNTLPSQAWLPIKRGGEGDVPGLLRSSLFMPLDEIIWDSRVWISVCGGFGYGNEGHHGMLDSRQIKVVRDDLPKGVEEFARDYKLAWSLEADYGLPSDFLAS